MTPKELQEAAEDFYNRDYPFDYAKEEKIEVTKAFTAGAEFGANYASTQHKEEIEELVSALEITIGFMYDIDPRKGHFNALIQKHRK